MNNSNLDIASNRHASKYRYNEQLRRVVWSCGALFFRNSPRICFGWRRMILRIFGATIGEHVHIYNSATIYMPWNLEIGDWSSIGEYAFIYNLGKVKIGKKTTISHRAHICAGTHDYNDPALPLIKPGISIGDQAWICADSFVGPGVNIGEGAIVGARGVAIRDVSPWDIVAGNPAMKIGERVLKK